MNMKKVICIVLLIICALSACLAMAACNGISKKDYDKLNSEYNLLLEEKNELEQISKWIDLYNSIELKKSFNEIAAMFSFEYAFCNGFEGVYSDGTKFEMLAYIWQNKDVFDMHHFEENQIVIVLLDGVVIYKQYGNQQFYFDSGTVRLPLFI